MTAAATPRLGFAYIPSHEPEMLRGIAVAASEGGLDDLWVWEDCFSQSGIASATAALAFAPRTRVGIGLLPAPLRNVALTAMEIATIERMFPGRLVAGVGHGVQDWMGQAGARVPKPLTLLREYEGALRRLLAGETVTVSGEYVTLTDVALDWVPKNMPTLMAGGTGPKTLEFAGELPSGTLLPTAFTDDEVRASVGMILAAHDTGPRSSLPHEIVYSLIAATGDGAAERIRTEVPRWRNATLDNYDGIGIAGDEDRIAEKILALRDLGVTTVVIQPTEDEPDVEGFIRFLGTRVRPLLHG